MGRGSRCLPAGGAGSPGTRRPRAQGLTGCSGCTDVWGEGVPAGPQPYADAAETQRPAADLLSHGGRGGLGGGRAGWNPSLLTPTGPGPRWRTLLYCPPPSRPFEGPPVLPLCSRRPLSALEPRRHRGVRGCASPPASRSPASSRPAAESSPGAVGRGSVFAEQQAEDREWRSHLGAVGPGTGIPACHRHSDTFCHLPAPSPGTPVTPQGIWGTFRGGDFDGLGPQRRPRGRRRPGLRGPQPPGLGRWNS